MQRIADRLFHYNGQNPFSDSQARNFSNDKVSNEFCPTSCFWSLFNDQHEILIGTRGSGKTFLLKMMRRSMLKKIDDPKATELIDSGKFLALYVPMQLEVLSEFKKIDSDMDRQLVIFKIFFNCLLIESLLSEIEDILNEENDIIKRAKKIIGLSKELSEMWFEDNSDSNNISSFDQIVKKVRNMYYSLDFVSGDLNEIPAVFKRSICSTLIATKSIICTYIELREEPTWIICVDEAEFLNENLLKCINNTFRSDSDRIALKVATLPFYYSTLNTLVPGTTVSPGNDFNYQIVDMKYDSNDFITLTNKLCSHRLKSRIINMNLGNVDSLEDFLGKIGNDDLIDYYRLEVGEENADREKIEADIISSFSERRRTGSDSYTNKRKTIYDKFAPIYFVREMYAISGRGNSRPGWYAGAPTVRKISQGNPRLFIGIMNALFEKARQTKLTPKAQHEVLFKFANEFCNSTKALEAYGPAAYDALDKIGTILKNKTHKNHLVSVSCSFTLKYKDDADFDSTLEWLKKAVAYSRVIIPEDAIINGIEKNTRFTLSNAYAAKYWIPMRGDVTSNICINEISNSYTVNVDPDQISLFEEEI